MQGEMGGRLLNRPPEDHLTSSGPLDDDTCMSGPQGEVAPMPLITSLNIHVSH